MINGHERIHADPGKNFFWGDTLYARSLREFMCAIVSTIPPNVPISENMANTMCKEADLLTKSYINQLNNQL